MPTYIFKNLCPRFHGNPVVTDFDAADDAEALRQLDAVAAVFSADHEIRLYPVYPVSSDQPIAVMHGQKGSDA